MIIKASDRRSLRKFLPQNYRQTVVARLRVKGHKIHPNTVYNVWHGRSANIVVAEAILSLLAEEKEKQRVVHATKKRVLALAD